MFKLTCPSCGAEVSFRSATSAMAVCEYCRSTVVRDADSVRDAGKLSAVLEDYSPIRIGTSGLYAGRRFTAIGRLQLRYDDGLWNEWYVLFDDGRDGWLSDASGQYALTEDTGLATDAPPFERLVPGGIYRHDNVDFYAADLRSARCVGGEGELPMLVGQGWQAKVADYRHTYRFLTLDYSDGPQPRRYVGKAVTLEALKAQLLREPDDIARSAGRLPGTVASLACPACGAPIAWVPGVAAQLHCPACGRASDATAGTAQVLDKVTRQPPQTSLALGDKGRIDGHDYLLIGVMRCTSGLESWTEYLLFSAKAGFLWLVESGTGWEKVKVLDEWPESVSASGVRLAGSAYTRSDAYSAQVVEAAGAFNWRVKLGDKTAITDYAGGRGKLTSERTPHELGWSTAQRVDARTVGGWFGKGDTLRQAALAEAGAQNFSTLTDAEGDEDVGKRAMLAYSAVLLSLNLPLCLLGGFFNWLVTTVALALLWLPLLVRGFHNKS